MQYETILKMSKCDYITHIIKFNISCCIVWNKSFSMLIFTVKSVACTAKFSTFSKNWKCDLSNEIKKLENLMIGSKKKLSSLGVASLRQTNTEYYDSLAKFCHLIDYDSQKLKITSLFTDLTFKWLENSEN